ncbi:MAG: alpha/beta fold hydrolase [Novosphingobium sp.]|uniref:alpha/beta hydrolase n=1 Tax=Novosphingobium sp. TaxID=1874826 RepID=UPI0032B7E5D8
MTGPRLEFLHQPERDNQGKPPLLFIHGGFHGAWCWAEHFMPWFAARGFDCHAISYRDHGGSERTGRHTDWRLKDYVADVRWAAEQMPRRPILVGHSLGGSIAQKLAAEAHYPALVLLAPSPIGGSNRAAMRMLASHPGAMWRALAGGQMGAALPAFMRFFVSPDFPAAEREALQRRCTGLTSSKSANDAFYFDAPKPRPLGIPTLVVSGENDWSIPRYKNQRLARAYGGDHIVVPTAHDIMCDTRWDLAADRVIGWLNAKFGK